MRDGGTEGARALRRETIRDDKRAQRGRMRARRGQTLIVFALSATVLIGLAGISIDVVRAYDLYARMQRAAEAGALAGVIYLPKYYTAINPTDGQNAISRALQETIKNGFGKAVSPSTPPAYNCPSTAGFEIVVCQVTGRSSDLRVTITETLSLVLLGGLGLQPITLQATGQAQYLPVVQLGSRAAYFGDQIECSPGSSSNTNSSPCSYSDTSQSHLQSFLASFNGPAELKEQGDPYVYCEEGPADQANSLLQPSGQDPSASSYTTYNGRATNHPQWTDGIQQHCGVPNPGVTKGNPDYQPDGYNGPATAATNHQGGYNYVVQVGSAISTASLWIYNPYFVPQPSGNPSPLDTFLTSGASTDFKGWDSKALLGSFNGNFDAPVFYFNTTITLYQVANLYDRSSDTQVASTTYAPFDNYPNDTSLHGCSAGQVYYPDQTINNGKLESAPNSYYNTDNLGILAGTGCVSSPYTAVTGDARCVSDGVNTQGAWCQMVNQGGYNPSTKTYNNGSPVILTPGTYRLVIEGTGLTNAWDTTPAYGANLNYGWGSHSYALKLCVGSVTTAVNCSTGGGNGAGQFKIPDLAVYAWNNMDVIFQSQLTSQSVNFNYPQTSCIRSNTGSNYACMDLGCISSEYAGRSITISLFDVGDGTAPLYVGISPPPGISLPLSNITYPYFQGQTVTKDGIPAIPVNTGGGTPLNGLWINVTVQLPSNYVGDCATSTGGLSGKSGWWQLAYMSDTGGLPHDKLAVKFTLVGSPEHIVPVLG